MEALTLCDAKTREEQIERYLRDLDFCKNGTELVYCKLKKEKLEWFVFEIRSKRLRRDGPTETLDIIEKMTVAKHAIFIWKKEYVPRDECIPWLKRQFALEGDEKKAHYTDDQLENMYPGKYYVGDALACANRLLKSKDEKMIKGGPELATYWEPSKTKPTLSDGS